MSASGAAGTREPGTGIRLGVYRGSRDLPEQEDDVPGSGGYNPYTANRRHEKQSSGDDRGARI